MEDEIENVDARRRRREGEWALHSSDDIGERRHEQQRQHPPVSTESTVQSPSLIRVYIFTTLLTKPNN